MNLLRTLSNHLFDFQSDQTKGELLFFKMFEASVVGMLMYQSWGWGFYLERISDSVMPLGLAHYVDVSFMFGGSLGIANAVLITLLLLLGYMRVSRWCYSLAFALLLFQYAARYSLGEIPHGTNLTAMVLLGLALAEVFFQSAHHRQRFTMGFTFFFVGIAYVLAASSKLVGTGLHWVDGRHLWLWLHEKGIDVLALEGEHNFNVLQHLALQNVHLATLFLVGGLLIELSACMLWMKPSRRIAAWALLSLHIGIFVMMHISFWLNIVLLIMIAVPWATWLDRYVVPTGPGHFLAELGRRYG